MTMIRLEQVSKAYNGRSVLDRVSLRVERGEVLGLVGPSGAGKTTLLRLIGGLEQPDSGRVLVESVRIGYVFQEPRLLPWRSAAANLEAALQAAGNKGNAARAQAREWLQRVGLAGFEEHYPAQLSGGMQQRVALARAFAVQPEILLLDEPFSNLDEARKAELLDMLRKIIDGTSITTVYVTHVPAELHGVADREVRIGAKNRLEASMGS